MRLHTRHRPRSVVLEHQSQKFRKCLALGRLRPKQKCGTSAPSTLFRRKLRRRNPRALAQYVLNVCRRERIRNRHVRLGRGFFDSHACDSIVPDALVAAADRLARVSKEGGRFSQIHEAASRVLLSKKPVPVSFIPLANKTSAPKSLPPHAPRSLPRARSRLRPRSSLPSNESFPLAPREPAPRLPASSENGARAWAFP